MSLALIMACSLIVNWILYHKFQWNLYQNRNFFIPQNVFENVDHKISSKLCSGAQCVNVISVNSAILLYSYQSTSFAWRVLVSRGIGRTQDGCWGVWGIISIYRPSFPDTVIPVIKIRWSWDHLISIMGILVMVRQHLYTEMDPVVHFYWHCLLEIRAWIFNHIPYLFETRYYGELKCNCFSINKHCHISDISHILLGNKLFITQM